MPYADPKRNNPTGTKAWADQEKAAGRDFSAKTDLGDIAGYYKEFGLGRGTGAEQQMNFHYKQGAQPGAAAPAPAVSGAGMGGGAGAGGGSAAPGTLDNGGAHIVQPETDSMAGLKSAAGMGGGGGDMSGGAGDNIGGPSKFRQGIGNRIPPQYSVSLAALRQVY